MLVFQKDFDHIAERCLERVKKEPSWLLEIISEINLYLPDDWRMTRSKDQFAIQIIAEDKNIILAGYSHSVIGEDKVLAIINTVYMANYPDLRDLKAAGVKFVQVAQKNKYGQHIKDEKGHVKINVPSQIKIENPEATRPNLYFFSPAPENMSSPLFARQYEKVKMIEKGKGVGDEYHRIHPLTKVGLDVEHFRWIKRNINTGHVEFVDKVNDNYHGKDYWILKRCTKEKGKAYLKEYVDLLAKYGVTPHAMPTSIQTNYEVEYKFEIDGNDFSACFDLIREFAVSEGFLLKHEGRPQGHVDIYFDDDRKTLYKGRASFRMRNKLKDNTRVTIKKQFPRECEGMEPGLYIRIEEEVVITEAQKIELLNGKPINVWPYRLIQYIAPSCAKIKPVLQVENKRKILILEDSMHRKAELSFDSMTYFPPFTELANNVDNRDEFDTYYEVEIESKGMPREELERIICHIKNNIGLKISRRSKYENGMFLLAAMHNGSE